MNDKSAQSKTAEADKLTSPLQKLANEWKIFFFAFFRPLTSLPFLLTLVSLYYANHEGIAKDVSLILQIIAVLFITIAAGAFYEAIRGLIEVDITQKKGASAVRNLSLSRVKAKNIFNREKEGASSDEIKNLVSLLEKDIANAIQEWNDILPGVAALEGIYNVMAEKESELEVTKKETAQLKEQLINQKELSDKEKKELKEKLSSKENSIDILENEINKLRLKTDSIPLGISGYASALSNSLSDLAVNPYGVSLRFCVKCGTQYSVPLTVIDLSGLCDACKATI
jgi:hypothetical protein